MPDQGTPTREAQITPSSASPDDAPDNRAITPEGDVPAGAAAERGEAVLPGAAASAPSTVAGGPPPGFIRQFELVDRVRAYDPHVDEHMLNRAYVVAMQAHGDQTRSNGDPYFSHPLAVAAILTELRLDPISVATGLLHDVVEDTDVTIDQIREMFTPEVARLVDGVTKISKRELAADTDGKSENFAKFLLATAKDVRVLLVKLADRLHNMRTLHYLKPEKRERIARETMEIYAPMAGRIGVHTIKDELEDLSFRHLNPSAYQAIYEGLDRLSHQAVRDVISLAQTLRAGLHASRIDAEVHSREKRPFSIWRKMQRKRVTFEELADIYAFRVIVKSTDECYRALGVIHQNFPMIPGEFDDYISTPKQNGYQSVHTAVIAPGAYRKGQRVEIQIRSKDMHETAERGVAAHWRYKEASAEQTEGETVEIGRDGKYSAYEWLRGVIETMQSEESKSALLDQAKIDLYQDQVFPFTPRGRVIPLPSGATALDFAYAIHTDVGDQYAGAKINGVKRPNRTALRNGDVVEILRSKQAPIPNGWEGVVVTGAAKSGIRRRIRALEKRDQRELGERIVTSVFAGRDLPYSAKAVADAAPKLGFASVGDLYQSVGRMDVSGRTVLETVFPNLDVGGQSSSQLPVERGGAVSGVSISGVTTGGAIRLATCCSPLPGERIVGVRDEKGGIVAHRIDCEALANAEDEDWLNLSWSDAEGTHYVASIVLEVNNRTGALGHIGSMLARYGADIVDLKLTHREVDFSEIRFDVAVRDARHLANVLTGLRASDYVVSAERREEEGQGDDG